jgi:hypothetical protein
VKLDLPWRGGGHVSVRPNVGLEGLTQEGSHLPLPATEKLCGAGSAVRDG